MKALILKHREWEKVFSQIKQDYAATPATYLIRDRMKRDLGFTYREHTEWTKEYEFDPQHDWRDGNSKIHIDFYSEEAQTFFMLKYMNRD